MLLGWVGILFAGTLLAGEVSRDGYRDFSSTDGRNIRGRIVKYDAQRKKLFFERDNKKQMWISPAAFCQEDRDYVKEWIIADQFLSNTKFRISATKEKTKFGFCYEITFGNRTGRPIEGLQADYRLYVDEIGLNGHKDKEHFVEGKVNVDVVPPNGKAVGKTKTAPLLEEYKTVNEEASYSSGGYSGTTRAPVKVKIRADRIAGIWIKIQGPKLDGKQVVRDVCFPLDVSQKHSWFGVDFNAPVPSLNAEEVREKSSEYARAFMEKLKEIRKAKAKAKAKMIKELSLFYDAQHDKNRQGSYASKIGKLYEKSRDFESALFWHEKSLQAGRPRVHRTLAELYSSGCPETYDGAKAVEHALIALEGHEKDPSWLEVLARAYARDGQFKMAIRIQRQAIERWQKKSGYKANCTEYKTRLELYKNGKPYTM